MDGIIDEALRRVNFWESHELGCENRERGCTNVGTSLETGARLSGACVMALAGMLSGCSGFFVPENNSGGGSGGGTGTGTNFVYVGNAQTNTMSGFQMGRGC